MYTKLASAIYNDIYGGLQNEHIGNSISIEQIEDEIVAKRISIMRQLQLNKMLPIKDLLFAINCIPVDCDYLERCPKCRGENETPNLHFEIPLLYDDLNENAIYYIGSTDRMNSFEYYIMSDFENKYDKYRRRGKNKPYVYIDPAPNANNKLDCFVFNAPFLKEVSVVAVFKDLRQIKDYSCCADIENMTTSVIDDEVRKQIVQEKLQIYRTQRALQINDQAYK